MLKINNLTSLISILIISISLGYVSFTGGVETTKEAYLFPKLITTVMIILSTFSLIIYFLNKTKSFSDINIQKLSVYLISLILFIFLGETIGFYFLAILIFLINSYYYSESKNLKRFIQNIVVTILFMAFIYLLFSVMLKVQVPRFFLL
tara:strand:- start:2034 stop:2480 length:447 start_codon:yes stop_codon:yes gene_type:complete